MLLGIQLLGLLFVFIMIYFTYLNYKRHNYGSRSFISWLIIWFGAAVAIILPNRLYNFMMILSIDRTQDLLFSIAFVVLFVIVFVMYVTIKKTKAKVEALVRESAINAPIIKVKKKK